MLGVKACSASSAADGARGHLSGMNPAHGWPARGHSRQSHVPERGGALMGRLMHGALVALLSPHALVLQRVKRSTALSARRWCS